MQRFSSLYTSCLLTALLAATSFISGCSLAPSSANTASSSSPAASSISGRLFGGQQPISGAHVYLYAAANTAGGASRSLLSGSGFVTTAADGTFSITGQYTCSTGDQVYVLALGGDAGGGANSSIALMSALGPCSALTPSTFIWINEVTTVASVYSLLSFITDATHIGSPDTNALAAAFANTRNMVNTSTGVSPALTPVGNGTVPQAAIDSLANSLAACINSPSGGSQCSSLFTYTTTGGSTPADTLQATLNTARNPTQNAASIYALASASPPFQPTLSSAPSTFALPVLFPSDVLTFFYNRSRNGVQSSETILTPANVNTATFGKKRSFTVDGYLYAQPLYTGGYGMPDGAVHDIVFASSVHGTVYAFDADGNNPAQGYLWRTSVVPSGETQVTTSDYGCGNPSPETTLLSTPVIDRSTGTLYAVSKTKKIADGSYIQRLHALSLLDGSEKSGSPVVITASIASTTGDGASGGTLTFNALKENQRAALLLNNGTVWIAYASHCDISPYHGWVLGYDAASLAQNAIYNNTPNGSQGGIWQAAGGPAADAAGSIYVLSGNGTFDSTGDLSDAAIRLTPPSTPGGAATAADYFVPYNHDSLSPADNDFGTSQPLLFTDTASGTTPNLLIATDKTGKIYLLNTAHLGNFATGPGGTNGDLQDFTLGADIYNNPAFFNNHLFIGPNSAPLQAFAFTPGTSTTSGSFTTTPSSRTSVSSSGGGGNGGFTPTISANGTANAVVWASTHNGTAVLYALDASDLSHYLYDSTQDGVGRDTGPSAVRFTSPIVANGNVFLGGINSLVVYGLLP